MNTNIVRQLAAIAVVALLTTQSALAQESADIYELSLEDLLNVDVTTATKTAGKSDQVPAVIEIITADQIRHRGYQHLGQVLNDICDNHSDRANWGIGEPVTQNVGFGFRFDTGQNILLLFNGQRINSYLPGNQFGGEQYLLGSIDRIEIIRGPGSALYGTGAFTAVINVISKKVLNASDESVQVGAEYIPTSNGATINSSFQAMVGKSASLVAGMRYSSEQGQELAVENALFGNAKLKDGVDYATDADLLFNSGSFNFYAKATRQQRRTFTGFNGVNPSTMDRLALSMYGYSAGIDNTFKFSDKTNLKLAGGWHQDNWTEVGLIPQFQVNADGTALVTDDSGLPILDNLFLLRDGEEIQTSFFIDGQGADSRSLDAEAQLTINYAKTNNLVVGVYVADDRILNAQRLTELNLDPLQFIPFGVITDAKNNWLFDVDASRQTAAFYSQIDYSFTDKLTVSAGARFDNYSGKGILTEQQYSVFNPRASVVYVPEKVGTFKLLFGTATRIPNGLETLSSVAILGNPSLRPEQLTNIQLQWINHWSPKLRTELGGFTTTIFDRLETNAAISDQLKAQGFIGQFVNVSSDVRQRNNGVNGKMIYQVQKSQLMLNFTQYFGDDNGYGRQIAYIPHTMINGDINIPYGIFNFNTGFNYRSGFTKTESDNRDVVRDYFIVRANVMARPTTIPFSFSLNAKNLLNTKYQFPSSSVDFVNHFPARGIEIILGVSYRMN